MGEPTMKHRGESIRMNISVPASLRQEMKRAEDSCDEFTGTPNWSAIAQQAFSEAVIRILERKRGKNVRREG
jgi:hypothetical protein